jgi:hypothetical protein
MNACREWKDQVLEFAVEGFAANGAEAERVGASIERGAEARRLEAHIKGCASCAAALAEMRARAARIDLALPKLAEGAELQEGFEARVIAQIGSRKAARISAGHASGNAASRRSNWLSGWRMRLAAAGVVCAVVIAAVVWPQVKKRWHIGEEPAVSISTWRSPTESLLQTPGRELLQSGPKLGEVYFPVETPARRVNK